MTPASSVSGDDKGTECFQVPEGFRPKFNSFSVQQGSGIDRWFLRIMTDGTAYACRYGSTGWGDINAGAYMPFHAVWTTSDEFPRG